MLRPAWMGSNNSQSALHMSNPAARTRLAAILVADVAGYSRLMSQDEHATLASLDKARSVFAREIAANEGRVVDMAGDSVLALFDSAAGALRAALAVQQFLAAAASEVPDARRMHYRIGLHLGDVIEKADGSAYGDGINTAARVQSTAHPDCVAATEAIVAVVRGRVAVDWEDLGDQRFKNLARPVRVFSTRPAGRVLPQPAPVPIAASSTRSDKPSLAVLPFTNLSGDPEQDYFADGMVEEIITGLARIRWLTVIARNSSFAYKGATPDLRTVGRELAVRYVVQGSVRRAGKSVRISAQLVEAESGGHLWAERFDGALDDVFDLQDQITAGVVAAIEPSVRQAEIERAKRKRPENLDAYDLYLRALEQSYIFTPAARSTGLSLLDAALALEPDYVEAHGVAAFCLQQRYLWGGRTPSDRQAALRHAEAVAAARTDDATALAFAGLALSALDDRHDVALVMVDRALERNPSSAIAHNASALINMMLARPEKSVVHAERSLRLSPFDPLRHIPECTLAVAKMASGEHEAALVCARRAVEANPGFTPGLTTLALCLLRLGRIEEARATVHRLVEIAPDTRIATLKERYLFANSLGFDSIAADLRVAGLPE